MRAIPQMPTPTLIAVNGITLEIFEAGQENQGNPIVLCHGWPEHAFSWRHQIPALVAAGYHVIVPNQRGYGRSSCPENIAAYDIQHLTADLVGLLDHFGYEDAVFVGHDWGANVVWSLALLYPNRVKKIINLALPYQLRTEVPWLDFMEMIFGPDHYFVHFNRKIGEADAVLEEHCEQFLRNLFRKDNAFAADPSGMMMIKLAQAEQPRGEPVMTPEELSVYGDSFQKTGFRSSIHWYRNLNRNWHLLADVDPVITTPALMIYGTLDDIPESPDLVKFVPNVDVVRLECGHWIQQEKPAETTTAILDWLGK